MSVWYDYELRVIGRQVFRLMPDDIDDFTIMQSW